MNASAFRVSVGLLLVALVLATFFMVFERKERMVTEPPSGQAASNRFFALDGLLARSGKVVGRGTAVPPDLDRYKYLVIGGDVALMDDTTAVDVLDWVDEGLTLIVQAGTASEMKASSFWKTLGRDGIASAPFGCAALTDLASDKPLSMCGNRVAVAHGKQDIVLGDDKGSVFVDHAYGKGHVVVMATLAPFSYRGLDAAVAQRLATRVFDLGGPKSSVFLIHRLDGPRVWSALLSRGWPALLAATWLLVAWAIGQAMRLGPPIEAHALDRRALLEHVQAAGEFLYARDRGRSLHRRLCTGLLARIRRHDPGAEDLEGEVLFERLAERYRLAPAQIARAFEPPADAQAFRDSVAILARLRRHP